jgi:non-specific serine/threonine protein kinase
MNRDERQKSPIAGDGSSSLKADETSTRQLGPYEGTVLDGRYLIERELGRGGIGVVYLARDPTADGQTRRH